jgi:hypothetical protein
MKNKIISDVLFKVLRILVRVVTEDIPDCYGKPGTSFQKKLQELFGRITSKVNNACQVTCFSGLHISVLTLIPLNLYHMFSNTFCQNFSPWALIDHQFCIWSSLGLSKNLFPFDKHWLFLRLWTSICSFWNIVIRKLKLIIGTSMFKHVKSEKEMLFVHISDIHYMAQLSEFQRRPNQIMHIIVFLFFVLHVVQIVHFTSILDLGINMAELWPTSSCNWKGTKSFKIYLNISAYRKNTLDGKHTPIFWMKTFTVDILMLLNMEMVWNDQNFYILN